MIYCGFFTHCRKNSFKFIQISRDHQKGEGGSYNQSSIFQCGRLKKEIATNCELRDIYGENIKLETAVTITEIEEIREKLKNKERWKMKEESKPRIKDKATQRHTCTQIVPCSTFVMLGLVWPASLWYDLMYPLWQSNIYFIFERYLQKITVKDYQSKM